MEIIILIASVVLLVSLYDYFSSKSWQQVTSASRNDVVFDKRNKKYGAYEIRKSYNKTLIMVIFGVVTTIGMSYGAYLLTKDVTEIDQLAYLEDQVLITDMEFPPIDDAVVIPDQAEKRERQEAVEKQIDMSEFEITDNETETRLNTQEDVGDAKIGDKDVPDGKDDLFNDEINDESEPVKKVIQTIDPPELFVDEPAEFPGGYAEMMKYFGKNMRYPEIALQAGIEGKANMQFVVEKNGSISNVNVQTGVRNCPECDKEATRVIKAMPQWKPGKINGRVVRSYYSMPIAFKIKNS